jgi:response regulator RpfG family c-di-GMP phosphodiesterase
MSSDSLQTVLVVDDAPENITLLSGRHFDPSLVHLLHEVLPEVLEIKKQHAEEQ